MASAAGLRYGSLGTDTGGSIRFPARATAPWASSRPTERQPLRRLPLAKSLDNVGPVHVASPTQAAILGVIAGHDPHDPTSSHRAVPDYAARIGEDMRGLRLGVDERFIRHGVHRR